MGNVLGGPMAPLLALAATHLLRGPGGGNPTLTDLEARHRLEQSLNQAERVAKEARELAKQVQRQADREREQARMRQEEASQAVAKVKKETERMKAQIKDAKRAAKHAEELAQEASKAAKEDAVKLVREAEEERKRSEKIRRDAKKAMAAVKKEAEKAQKAADEQCHEAEAGKTLAEEMARTATEEVKKVNQAKEDAEAHLKEGIQPVVTPTAEELVAAKRRIQYQEDRFHFAVAGVSGSGKSSLINAFRGLASQDRGAAAVGVIETTLEMTRYSDADPRKPFVWYDFPGAGTLKCRDWLYFNNQGLYVFDCIIVLFDVRFTRTDIAILANAKRFNIPTYIVRTKADQHIRNIMTEMGYGSKEGDAERRNKMYRAARKQFIEKTRKNVEANLRDADLLDQRVYIVSSSTLLNVVLNKTPKKMIDEIDLLHDVLNEAYARRRGRIPVVE